MGLQPTNAGIDFQQRVSAYMMLLMEFDIDISMALQVNARDTIKALNFEDCECIDDLVITLDSGKRIYFQMKRTISLSDNTDSEFYGVCEQFVKQYLKQNENDEAYVLVTRSETSKAISVKLKRILEGIRLANDLRVIEKLNEDERKIYDKICSNIKLIYKNIKEKEISEDELLKIFLRIYIEMFDIENGEEYERTIKIVLWKLIDVDVELFWKSLIAKAIDYGAKRRCLSKENLKEQCEVYFGENKDEKKASINSFFNMSWQDGYKDIQIQVDYVVAIPTQIAKEKMKIEEEVVCVFEWKRFDDSKKRDDLIYVSPDKVIVNNELEFQVLFRCATKKRCQNFIKENNLDKKYKVRVFASREDEKRTEVELLYKGVLEKKLEEKKECICVNCGKAIFDSEGYTIEIDNEECSNEIGIVHQECVRPVDRVIGKVVIPEIEDYGYLKNFDIDCWNKKIRKGKRCWENIEKMSISQAHMVIDTNEVFRDGNYCVYQLLENGEKRYTCNRGSIDRVSRREASKLEKEFKEQIIKAKENGNPIGYSSESYSYGMYTQILEMVGDKEEFIECVDAKSEIYNEAVAKIYNDGETYYAPISYLSIEGDPFILPNGVFPLLTDPFDIPKYIKNWEKLIEKMPEYEVCIIKDDNEFILKMISLINRGIVPVVNGMFDMKGKIIRGVIIIFKQMME